MMKSIKLSINGKAYTVEVAEDMPLLWVIRDYIGLTGTKFGCGKGLCGACTVLLNGKAIRSCSVPVSKIGRKKVMTIEGISEGGMHAMQHAWVKEQVPQCGYCQSGQIMSAIALVKKNPNPSDEDINQAMDGNICRCGSYQQIRMAIHNYSSTQ